MRSFRHIPAQPRVAETYRALPPLAQYEAWLNERRACLQRGCWKTDLSAHQHRRIAQLARTTVNCAEIGRCLGVSGSAVRDALGRLPEHLK